jgi:methylphosphotriester-DNA--protein-cysteine methyltransferase
VLDDVFAERLPPHPDEPLIARIAALLADNATHDLADAAARVGIGQRALLDLTKRYFGFPPKILSMRTRLRALVPMLLDAGGPDFATVPAGYHDVSHFIRDAKPLPRPEAAAVRGDRDAVHARRFGPACW